MKTKYIVYIILASAIVLIIFRLASNKKKINEKNNPAPVKPVLVPVKVASASNKIQEVSIMKTGSVAPLKEAKVLVASSGTLLQVKFSLGQHVTRGQMLAMTDTRTQQLELQKAETSAAKLRSDLQIYTELLGGNAATRQQVENIRQDYLNATNQVNQARKSLADSHIKAPIGGVIATKPVEQGIYVSLGTEIACIVDLSSVKVQVNLTETEVYQIKLGQQVKITTDVYPGKSFSGKVGFISPQADQAHSYLAEIQIENSRSEALRSGTFVYVDFSKKNAQRILVIPREALTSSLRDATVYVVQNGVAKLKNIKVGAEMGSFVAVVSGLVEGDLVVTSGQINLRDGSQVSTSK
jgi:membrane fusion protein (multidrug efflux system)